MPSASDVLRHCPSCKAIVNGRFCPECGTSLAVTCTECGSALPTSARFCNECGNPCASRSAQRKPARRSFHRRSRRTLGVAAAVVLSSATALVAIRIGQRPAAASTAMALDVAPAVQQGIVNAPDISSMSPVERAMRLYDRVMRVTGEGKADSVEFFAPMALAAFAAIPNPDLDARYRMARIAFIAGAMPVARAEADTILRSDSTHLLGLMLIGDIARVNGDSLQAKRVDATIARVARSERRRPLAEYRVHHEAIDRVLRRLRVL